MHLMFQLLSKVAVTCWSFYIRIPTCPAEIKVGRIHLCRVKGNTV